MKNTPREESAANETRILAFQSTSEQGMGSFQALQTLSKALFESCSNVQRLMAANRQNRLIAQTELANCYQQLANTDADQEQHGTEPSILTELRQQISVLEQEHIDLHQQFISLQSQFRQVVRDQKKRLVGSINRTRARTARSDQGFQKFQDNTPGFEFMQCDIDLHDDGNSLQQSLCA